MTLQKSDQLVIFGITGDLAKKMTFPSLYNLEKRGLLTTPILGVAFDDWTIDQLSAYGKESIETVEGSIDEAVFSKLIGRFSYVHGDFKDPALYAAVGAAISDAKAPTFYLEIPPGLFVTVAQQLATANLLHGDARVVFEKPFGTSLSSAQELNSQLHAIMREEQIFRIDHYLGKQPIQDLIYLRFANTLLEKIWNGNDVDCIMVTMAEDFGVADRGSFYDAVGTLRDVVQNHLLQVIGLIAMEAPVETLTQPRIDLFKTIPDANPGSVVRGQYDGYLDVDGVAPESNTETFVALKLTINSLRWGGIPVFIRAGKEMPVTATEVVVRLRNMAGMFLGHSRVGKEYEDVILRIGADPGISMSMQVKSPQAETVEPVRLDVSFKSALGYVPLPYETLLSNAMAGDASLFPDQVTEEETWRIVQPILDEPQPVLPYKPGTWGPKKAHEMVSHHGGWREPTCPDRPQS